MRNAFKLIARPYTGFSKNTWKFLAAGFINATCLTLTIYFTLYLNALHFSSPEIGLIIVIFSIGGLVGGYLGGWLTDKYSALTICKVSLLISGISIFLIVASKNFYYLSVLAVFIGFFTALFRPAFILALTTDEKSTNIEKIIALRRVAINLGMASGAAIFGFIASINFYLLFFIMASMNVLAFIVLRGTNDVKNITSSKKIFGKEQRNPGFIITIILMFSISLIFNQTQVTYPLFLKNNLYFNIQFISMLFMLNGILIASLQMPITHLFSRLNTNLTCALGGFLISLGLSVLPICSSKAALITSCCIWTLGEIIFYPAILALIIKLAGNKKGKGVGIYQVFFSFASFVAPAIGTFSYSYNQNLIWYAGGILGLMITLYFLLSIRNASTHFIKFSLIEHEGTP